MHTTRIRRESAPVLRALLQLNLAAERKRAATHQGGGGTFLAIVATETATGPIGPRLILIDAFPRAGVDPLEFCPGGGLSLLSGITLAVAGIERWERRCQF